MTDRDRATRIPPGFRCVRCSGTHAYCIDCGSSDCVCPEDYLGDRALCDHSLGALVPVRGEE